MLFFSSGAAALPSAKDASKSTRRVAKRERAHDSAPVTIEYFRASPAPSAVRLVWSVFSDKDVAGFRIYRASRNDGYVVVTGSGLIPAWHQEHVDAGLASSTLYRYVLGVVFADGSEFLSQAIEAYPK
jgi:hypothetical protein